MSAALTEGSVAHKVVAYFRENQEEELTRSDIGKKFDCAAAGVDTLLRRATEAGLLTRERNDSGMVWTAGPEIGKASPPAPAPVAGAGWKAAPAAERKPRAAPTPTPAIDFDAIAIETNVPKPGTRTAGLAEKLEALGARMLPGSSVVLPDRVASRFIEAMRQASLAGNLAQRWSRRKIDEQTARVWRDA